MEILSTTPVQEITWYAVVLFFAMMTALVITIHSTKNDNSGVTAIFALVFIVILVIMFACPMTKDSETSANYTVEIIEPEQYQKLIESGYTFDARVYENRNIYKISGPIIGD